MRQPPIFRLAVAIAVLTGCAEHHVPVSDAGTAPPADAGPRTCELVAGNLRLVPVAGNPPGCTGGVLCRLWFGHGQHLSCPADEWVDSSFAYCDVWDCLCVDGATERFVADFSTLEVADTRGEQACRYTLVAEP